MSFSATVLKSTAAVACMAALILAAAGCNRYEQKSEVPLVPVTGEVTLGGETPVEEAVVEYIPIGGTQGQGGFATTDAKGFYEIASPFGEPGLTGGDYRVVISKKVLPPGAVVNPEFLGPADNPAREILAPNSSNRDMSTLKAKVPTSGKAHHKFSVKKYTGPILPAAG
jgi:hypothetical protein